LRNSGAAALVVWLAASGALAQRHTPVNHAGCSVGQVERMGASYFQCAEDTSTGTSCTGSCRVGQTCWDTDDNLWCVCDPANTYTCIDADLSTAHALLGATHTDTATCGALARGDIIVAQTASPTWTCTHPAAALDYVVYDGTDTVFAPLRIPTGTLSSCTDTGVVRLPSGQALRYCDAGSTLRYAAYGDASGAALDVACSTCISLGSEITGTLPIANGGTGQTTATAAFDALDPLTTKGDVIAHDGVNSVRVAVGTDGALLMADTASAAGVKWSAPDTQDVLITLGPLLAAAGFSTTATIEVAYFTFPGSDMFQGTLTHTIKGNLYRAAGSGTCAWRIKDITNATTLCTSATTTSASTTNIVDCGTISSVPTGDAQMAIELVVAGTATCGSKSGGYWRIE
jgi:hypothetical protein